MAYREFLDDHGTQWTVWDTYPASAHCLSMANLLDGWLTFEAGTERRRLVPAPVGWLEAPDDRLRQWLDLAEHVRRRLDADTAHPVGAIPALGAPTKARVELGDPLRISEDVRSLIDRSRQTLEQLDRAIEGQTAPFGDPPQRDDDRRRK